MHIALPRQSSSPPRIRQLIHPHYPDLGATRPKYPGIPPYVDKTLHNGLSHGFRRSIDQHYPHHLPPSPFYLSLPLHESRCAFVHSLANAYVFHRYRQVRRVRQVSRSITSYQDKKIPLPDIHIANTFYLTLSNLANAIVLSTAKK